MCLATYLDKLALSRTERDFQQQVIDLARLCGWRIAHFRPARTERGWRTAVQGDTGWPDLVLCRPPVTLFRELKAEKGKLTDDQAAWLAQLAACGLDTDTWRPSDWPDIEAALASRRR